MEEMIRQMMEMQKISQRLLLQDPEIIKNHVQILRDTYTALIGAGFSREEAMAIITSGCGVPCSPAVDK